MQRLVRTGDVLASWSSTRRVVSSVSSALASSMPHVYSRVSSGSMWPTLEGNSSVSSRATASHIDGEPSGRVRPTSNAIDSESSARARPTLHVISSDSNAGRCAPVGAVERAFASVRIVEANVCKGGEWLVPPMVRGVRVLMRLLA
ncbi:hypothetical protein PF003_g25499 [Phytophthora fragariae]|nr:hypothetical protein PF003_g25499 [Phytophthora fragariae]